MDLAVGASGSKGKQADLTVRRLSLCKTVRDVSLILQQLQLLKIVERDGCGKNRHVQPYHGSAVGGPVLKSKL